MMDSGNGSKEMPAGSLCRSGCGFYGSAATEGMCSKCHKDYLRKKQNSPVPAATALASPSLPVSVNTSSHTVSDPISPIVTSSSVDTASTIASAALSSTATGSTTINNAAAAAHERVQPPIEEEGGASAKSPEASDDSCPSPATSGDSPDGSEKGKKKKNRCTTCRKKVGLTGFECRCGGLYCSIHRYSDKHSCTFDYRSHGQEEIRKNNPIVVGEKIKKL